METERGGLSIRMHLFFPRLTVRHGGTPNWCEMSCNNNLVKIWSSTLTHQLYQIIDVAARIFSATQSPCCALRVIATTRSRPATSVHFVWSYGQAEFRRLDFSHSVKHLWQWLLRSHCCTGNENLSQFKTS